jgi:hypothetical protein
VNEDSPFVECESTSGRTPLTAPYDGLLEVLLQTGKQDQAFWYADRRQQREMFEVLSVGFPRTTDGAVNSMLDSWQETRGRLVGAQQALVSLASGPPAGRPAAEITRAVTRHSSLLDQQTTELLRAAPSLGPCVRVGAAGMVEVQKTLPPGTVLLFPVTTARSVHVFALTNGTATAQMSAVTHDQIGTLRREYLGLLQARTALTDSELVRTRQANQRTLELARGLYEALLRPVERELTGARTLVVVLPRDLGSLPLHTLRKSALAGDPYLVERFTVSYLPSASAMLLPQAVPRTVKDVVALGCPGETSWDVEYELRDIRSFYKDLRLHFGKDATIGTLRNERADVLHLAAELSLDDRRPDNAHLVLSDGKSAMSTTRIPLGELLSLPSSGVVIVSNLSDAHAQIHPAEPYVLLASGSGMTLLTSYVPTRGAKKMFWAGLYAALASGVGPDAAYRRAQLEMLKDPKYAGPHFWAPFFLWSR